MKLSTDFQKTLEYQISVRFVHWAASCSMRMDRETRRES